MRELKGYALKEAFVTNNEDIPVRRTLTEVTYGTASILRMVENELNIIHGLLFGAEPGDLDEGKDMNESTSVTYFVEEANELAQRISKIVGEIRFGIRED